jgi:hypothetical protein
MFVETNGAAVELVARGVPVERALGIALEYGGAGQAMVAHWKVGSSRCFQLVRRTPDGAHERLLTAIVPCTTDFAADAARAMFAFEKMFLNDPGAVWNGSVEADQDYERRVVDGKQEAAT